MADLATIQSRIDQIDVILSGGISSTSFGDRRVDYDLEELRVERDRLSRIVAGSSRSQYRRVVFKSG